MLVKDVIPKHLEATTAKLVEAGCKVEEFDDAVRIISDGKLHHTQVTTLPYPGFPTDMQPQMAVILGIAEEPVQLRRAFLKTVSNMWMN